MKTYNDLQNTKHEHSNNYYYLKTFLCFNKKVIKKLYECYSMILHHGRLLWSNYKMDYIFYTLQGINSVKNIYFCVCNQQKFKIYHLRFPKGFLQNSHYLQIIKNFFKNLFKYIFLFKIHNYPFASLYHPLIPSKPIS